MQQDEMESGFDLKKIVSNLLSYWHWYLISLVICAMLAYTYLYFATPLFRIHATMLVENAQTGNSSGASSMLDESSILSDLGLTNVTNSVNNEMAILQSHSLMEKIVRDMQLNIKYTGVIGIKEVEMNKIRTPFEVKIISLSDKLIDFPLSYKVKVEKDGVILSDDKKEIKALFGAHVPLKNSVIQILSKPLLYAGDSAITAYSINIIPYEMAVESYLGKLSVLNNDTKAATISLTLNDETLPKRGIDMLNNLINTYVKLNIEDKNRVADSTVAFINNRLLLVSDELNGIEKEIQSFKQVNKLTDLSTQSQLLVTNTSDYVKQLAAQQTLLDQADALESYLRDDKTNKRVVPTNLTLQTDPNFSSLIQSYNQLQLERERQSAFTTEQNPAIKNLDAQIARIRGDLISNISVIKRNIDIAIKGINSKLSTFDAQISQVPAKEREFLEYSRQQAIKQDIYVFL
ncbi:MAG TPA: Wzz/FepE/Etk N-terminal domain-containing protein, partial [Chitinophagaceae bacterium]|nr:Wzz/FepE/Etk N-terminal domain-containing protein [Chitinophagaceae bacterium]